jgi:hypothetical protein
MSLKHVDLESALRRLAERRIEEAMREGKFDNLPGRGKPLDLEPMPADENARLMWWAIRLLKNNDFTPDEVRIRKQIDLLKDELAVAKTEQRVVFLVTAINAAVRHRTRWAPTRSARQSRPCCSRSSASDFASA